MVFANFDIGIDRLSERQVAAAPTAGQVAAAPAAGQVVADAAAGQVAVQAIASWSMIKGQSWVVAPR